MYRGVLIGLGASEKSAQIIKLDGSNSDQISDKFAGLDRSERVRAELGDPEPVRPSREDDG